MESSQRQRKIQVSEAWQQENTAFQREFKVDQQQRTDLPTNHCCQCPTWYVSNDHLVPHEITAAAAAKSLQSCPTLCDPRDGSPPGSPVPGTLQARTLEWVATSFSSA